MTENNNIQTSSIQSHKDYLQENVNIYLEPMVKDLLKSKPKAVLDFMINWLENRKKSEVQSPSNLNNDKIEKHHSEKSFVSSEDEDEDAFNKKVSKKSSVMKKKNGISAEVYNPNSARDFKARVIEKTEAQSQSIRKILGRNFMFNGLNEKDKEIVVNAMDIKEFEANDFVIKQGDDGSELFIVDSGILRCTLKKKDIEQEIFIKNYSSGELFGELALMYNVPRAASIMAIEKSVLFALDRETFNNIVKGSIIKTREKNENFLAKIDILKDLDSSEVQKLCDCLQQETYLKGDCIIKEGEEGDKFYLIEEGTAVAFKTDESGVETEIFSYNHNDYFGELALLNGNKRKATIRVTSESMIVYCIDRAAFKRLLGPIEDILMRNQSKYELPNQNN